MNILEKQDSIEINLVSTSGTKQFEITQNDNLIIINPKLFKSFIKALNKIREDGIDEK
jgi:hypothetical protein